MSGMFSMCEGRRCNAKRCCHRHTAKTDWNGQRVVPYWKTAGEECAGGFFSGDPHVEPIYDNFVGHSAPHYLAYYTRVDRRFED